MWSIIFEQMGMNWALLILVGVLLGCGSSLDWFGSGNWTADNITELRGKISGLTSGDITTYGAFAKSLSDDLNNIWAPAWNVVVTFYMYGYNFDTVLCGYGFNGHWFWLNGNKINANYVSFIIWKDYNCVNWFSIVPFTPTYQYTSYSTFDYNAASMAIQSSNSSRNTNDIWNVAYDVQRAMSTVGPPLLPQRTGYSVVASQDINAYYFAQVCAKDYAVIAEIAANRQGSALILQMRAM